MLGGGDSFFEVGGDSFMVCMFEDLMTKLCLFSFTILQN